MTSPSGHTDAVRTATGRTHTDATQYTGSGRSRSGSYTPKTALWARSEGTRTGKRNSQSSASGMSRSCGVSAKLLPELLARLDSTAAAWGLSRAATLRRLVELADVEGLKPTAVPSMDELIAIAAEKARAGNMAAVSFLAARQPNEREVEFQRLLERLGAGSQ
jgi:hypothetical protein